MSGSRLQKDLEDALRENAVLKSKLSESEETLNAIRSGDVDAIVVSGENGEKIFSLTSSETPYRIIIEEMDEGAATITANGIILYCNPRFARMVSIPAEQITGSDFSRFISENDRSKFKKLLKTCLKKRTKEIFRVFLNGEQFYLQLSFIGLPADMEGDICIIASDISLLRNSQDQLQEALRESEIKAKMLIKYAPTGIYELDYRGPKFLTVNDAMCEISGFSREEFLTMDPFQLLDEQSTRKFSERIKKILAGERIEDNVEFKVRVKDGRELWVSLNVKIISHGGKSSHALVIANDITERKRFERELKDYNETLEEKVRLRSEEILGERQRLYNVLETLPVFIILLDKDYHVSFSNKFFRERFGEAHGKRCYEHLYKKTGNCENCETFTVMKTKAPHHWEWTGPDNRCYDIYDFPFIEADGSMQILEMGIDITRRKKAEENLRENQVYLQELNQILLKSNKELENFAYVASHDLQEPLRTVTSFAQILSMKYKDQLDDSAKEYINFVVEGAERMYDLINGLLDYSRISRKKMTLSKVDINKIIETVKANLDHTIKERKCIIESEHLPEVSADYSQMIQLFQNLIANGIKFSKNSPHIIITAKREKSTCIFSVRDEGIGIEPQYFDKIFEIFKRLNPREQFEGTGIGLAICKRIIENHNGTIWLESEAGKGTVFHFTLNDIIKN